MKSRYEQFTDDISYGLTCKLDRARIYHNDWVHRLIPDSLITIIENEINKALRFKLSPTQLVIFNNLNEEALESLKSHIIGDISFGEDFSYLTNTGVKTKGLCKLYYNNLHWDKSEHLWGKIFKITGYNPQPRSYFFKGMTCATKNYLQGTMKEEHGFKEREVHIISIFCFALAKLASPKEQLCLASEINQPENQAIKIMRTLHDFDKCLALVSEIDSTGYLTYINNLFDLLLRDNVTHGAFKDKLPRDISNTISFFLTKKDECNLVCVNKSAVNEKEKALEDYKNIYCKK